MTFDKDGLINPLVMTKSGPPQLHSLDPYQSLDAGRMNSCDPSEGAHPVVSIIMDGHVVDGPLAPGAWMRYAGADFGPGAVELHAEVSSATGGGQLEIHLDSLDGPLVAVCVVPYTGGWDSFQTVHCAATNAVGLHDFVAVARGASVGGLFTIRALRFSRDHP
jgi:hypothetical protein